MLPFRGRVCVCVRMNKEKKKNDKKRQGGTLTQMYCSHKRPNKIQITLDQTE